MQMFGSENMINQIQSDPDLVFILFFFPPIDRKEIAVPISTIYVDNIFDCLIANTHSKQARSVTANNEDVECFKNSRLRRSGTERLIGVR